MLSLKLGNICLQSQWSACWEVAQQAGW
jgi:hypothetical protein